MRETVLLLTSSVDFFVPERVAAELAARGARPLRIDTDDYPAHLDLRLGLSAEGRGTLRLRHAEGWVDGDEVAAVWLRRRWPPRLPEDLDPLAALGIHREVNAHWRGLEDLLADRRWVNRPAAEDNVEGHKLHQLARARAAGLRVPDTLVSNDPDAVRAFVEKHDGDVVAKMLTALSTSMDGSAPTVHTRPLTPEDLDHLDELRLGPMCFQPRIHAREELRVAWVEGRPFVGAIDAGGDVDWRRGGGGGWRPGRLDDETAHALDRFMRGLGLSYGGIDLIVPHEGPPVFLEVNPSGEWGMLERFLDLPIAAALADALLESPA